MVAGIEREGGVRVLKMGVRGLDLKWGLEYLGQGGRSTWERRVGVPGTGWLEYLGQGGQSTWERRVGVPGTGWLEYLGEEGWSTWDRGVGVPGTGGLEYLGQGGWSTGEVHYRCRFRPATAILIRRQL